MMVLSSSGHLAVMVMEGSAAFILLVLYALLAPSFPRRFFHYWVGGWAVYVAMEAFRTVSLWGSKPIPHEQQVSSGLAAVAAALSFAAVLECCGEGARLKYLWPFSVIAVSGFVALGAVAKQPVAEQWAESLFVCLLYLTAGWMLWRSQSSHRGVGWKLLAAAMILRGLHGLDQPYWQAQPAGLLRSSFHGLFALMMGIGMAVLVLEAGRARTDELNEKMRRLALITAEALQSFRVDQVLEGFLQHLVESLGASHGVVLLFDDPANPKALVCRASVGFGERARRHLERVSPGEQWVQDVCRQEVTSAFVDAQETSDVQWSVEERLTSGVLVRVPGKAAPLGLLAIGSSTPRTFESDERQFLANVANLLGLTVQNVVLYETAADSRRQWLDTFDSIDDLILVHSPKGEVLRANRALAARLETQPEALLGRSLRDVLRQGTVPWSRCPYCEGVAGKEDAIDPSFGGYYLATDSAFHDSEGKRLGTIHVLKDFTSRRQIENKFRALFEKSYEGVFISTPDGQLLDFNGAFMRTLGYDSPDELVQAHLPSQFYVDPADHNRLQRLLKEFGEVADFEFQFRRRDGEIRTARESSFATRDDSGAIVAYQGFLLDITEQKQAELDIRRRNRELLALNAIAELLSQQTTLQEGLAGALQKVTDLFAVDTAAIYLLDEGKRTVDRAAAVGFRSVAAGHAVGFELSPALLQQIRQVRATLLSGAAPGLPEEFRESNRAEGVRVSQVVVLWAKDRIMGFLIVGCREMREFSTAEINLLSAVGNQVATAIDKSLLLEKTREAYDSLRLAQEQLLQSEKMAAVGQLISGVAHELNNPLTAILGYSQLLKSEEAGNQQSADYVEKLYKQAQRTHRIVENLLSFSRQHKPERSPVQLNDILEDTLALREYDMRRSRIAIHREFDPQLPLTGGDFHQLQQVFLNLLNNAVDAIQEKGDSGDIWIHTGVAGNRLRVEITDSGPGIQSPHRIFDPFYTTKPVGKGTGLGLSICYGIVKEHGGEIHARNAPPRGASFSISLPLLPEPSKAASKDEAQEKFASSARILLLDHEETVLQLEQETLVARGASVCVARTPQEAVEILKRNSIDAIVSDAEMFAETPAADLHSWIEKNRPDLAARVVFTTSSHGPRRGNHAMRKSGCPVLRKPFSIDGLCKAVHTVLAVPAAR